MNSEAVCCTECEFEEGKIQLFGLRCGERCGRCAAIPMGVYATDHEGRGRSDPFLLCPECLLRVAAEALPLQYRED